MDAALLDPPAAPFAVDLAPERSCDATAVEALVGQAFGPGRFAKTAERVREGARFRADLSFCAWLPHRCHPGRSAAESRDPGAAVARVVPGSRVGSAARDDNEGELAGAVRLWSVHVGAAPVLFLGPIAVASHLRGRGVAAQLVERACAEAAATGEKAVVLVGDLDRFASMGFAPVPPGRVTLPGPVDDRRLLWRGLVAGALDALQGPLA